jgi:methionyl-tRNA formyltransferase
VNPLFDTQHPFEALRDRYECDTWFGGQQPALDELADTLSFDNINQPEAVSHITRLRPDAAIVFGTRKLSRSTIQAGGPNLMNLHGGDPEYYRGLDSHLWAIYHGDYANLVTSLHAVNDVLDDGPVIGIRPIPLSRGLGLHELRRHNTECAVRLSLDALDELSRSGSLPLRQQRQKGRYYSYMPSVLKGVCVTRFEQYCASLP